MVSFIGSLACSFCMSIFCVEEVYAPLISLTLFPHSSSLGIRFMILIIHSSFYFWFRIVSCPFLLASVLSFSLRYLNLSLLRNCMKEGWCCYDLSHLDVFIWRYAAFFKGLFGNGKILSMWEDLVNIVLGLQTHSKWSISENSEHPTNIKSLFLRDNIYHLEQGIVYSLKSSQRRID